ncbi:SLAIN motif-containing protein-like isoform X1 [Engraulis encrasicolus]|uniref:SLAIN motif-containing protein-like isoform X1 n=1 Tax=Engraulis encrasicolus TaxID=184585 RepID=UPI002FCF658F
MVVPDGGNVVQTGDNGGSSTSGHMATTSAQPDFETEQELAGVELEEVRKLQELVRRLEVQNQSLRNRGTTKLLNTNNSNLTAVSSSNINNQRTLCEGIVSNSSVTTEEDGGEVGGGGGSRDLELSPPPLDSCSNSSEDMSPLPEGTRLDEGDDDVEENGVDESAGFRLACTGASDQSQEQAHSSPSPDSCESDTLGGGTGSDAAMDHLALDEVDVLDLEDCVEPDDEDSWLYVSPKKQPVELGPQSPLKWCRQVLDHPSPETEVACKSLINRLDQSASRWRNVYSSPSQSQCSVGSTAEAAVSPGYHKSTNKSLLTCGSSGYMNMHSALSSQSSVDSELSTSDDSISMGYKLQDLTDVQIMARLQEESLRQDYASSSTSASRRSSSASLQSLRRGAGGGGGGGGASGAYSDQELDSYSLEDEEEAAYCGPGPGQRRLRCSPSPLGSPRCQSPSSPHYDYGRAGPPPRAHTPRRSLQGPSAELLKYARSEEELRHSMPNLVPRTTLRSLEALRNSRSMEANLQSSGNRMSRLPQSPSTGVASTRLRGTNQSPLSLRAPVKALSPMGSAGAAASRQQPVRGAPGASAGPNSGARRVQSPGPANGGGGGGGGSGAYPAGRTSLGAKQGVPARGLGAATPGSRGGRLSQTPRRSFGMTKISDESWKDGCY